MPIISDAEYREMQEMAEAPVRFYSEDGNKPEFEGISQDLRISEVYTLKESQAPHESRGNWEDWKDRNLEEVEETDLVDEKAWLLDPGQCHYLAETVEEVDLDERFLIDVASRSSWARYGVRVRDVAEGLEKRDKEHHGKIPLTLNVFDKPILLREKDSVCQAIPYEWDEGFIQQSKMKRAYRDGSLSLSLPEKPEKDLEPNIKQLNIELSLADKLKKFKGEWIDPHKDNSDLYEEISLDEDDFTLGPGEFCLGSSREVVGLDSGYAGHLDERGPIIEPVWTDKLVNVNAPWIQPGFEGTITFEIYRLGPVKWLESGEKIGRMEVCSLERSCDVPYDSKYSGQREVLPGKVHEDFP